jgi:hypothetical protein
MATQKCVSVDSFPKRIGSIELDDPIPNFAGLATGKNVWYA